MGQRSHIKCSTLAEPLFLEMFRQDSFLFCVIASINFNYKKFKSKILFLTLPATGFFGPFTGQNPVGLRFCNKNWYTYSLFCYKSTENFFRRKNQYLGCDVTYWTNNWRKMVKKVKKQHFFQNFSSFYVRKTF